MQAGLIGLYFRLGINFLARWFKGYNELYTPEYLKNILEDDKFSRLEEELSGIYQALSTYHYFKGRHRKSDFFQHKSEMHLNNSLEKIPAFSSQPLNN